MIYYLAVLGIFYATFLLAQRGDCRARRAFAGRLGAIHRARDEFWRLRVWAQEARERGDGEAAAGFMAQAAALVPGLTGSSVTLRREHPRYTGEIGWMGGILDDELAEIGRSLASEDLRACERWITGRGRPSLQAVLEPPRIGDDVVTGRIHMAIGIVVGAVVGFGAWLGIYWGDMQARLSTMFFFIVIGAAVLGHIAGKGREQLWAHLFAGIRHYGWTDPL